MCQKSSPLTVFVKILSFKGHTINSKATKGHKYQKNGIIQSYYNNEDLLQKSDYIFSCNVETASNSIYSDDKFPTLNENLDHVPVFSNVKINIPNFKIKTKK